MTHTIATAALSLIENSYAPLPIKPGTKSPDLPGWSRIDADHATVEKWKAEGRGDWGIGIRGDLTPGVDLDISDKLVLGKVLAWSRENIGVVNSRVGRAPRLLFTCRSDTPFRKMSSRKFLSPDGETHQVEVLGKGTQYVAYAIHPITGKPYQWEGADPLDTPAELLPTLTPEKARELIDYFESVVPQTWTPISKASLPSATEHEGSPLKTAALHRIRSAMDAIPNKDLPYEEWVRIMYALWKAVDDQKWDGFEIFDEWSAKSTKYDPEETSRVWEATHDVKHIGAGTLFHLAKQNGWAEPPVDTSLDFNVVEDIPDERPSDGIGGANDNSKNQGSPRFVLETLDDLAKLPKPKWLVEGWFPEDATGILYGKWGSGKSFLAFDLGLHIAYGLPSWHGADILDTGRKVLVLAREGHQGFVDRAEAFRRRHNIRSVTENFVFLRAPVNFMHEADFRALDGFIRSLGVKFALVIVDTVARVMAGADMSAPESVTAFMERCDRLSKVAGGTVVGVHHENKSGTMMGSTYFEANADFVFGLTRENADSAPLSEGTIKCTKMKDGPDGWSRSVKFAAIEWEAEGEPRGSLAIDAIQWSGRKGVTSASKAAGVLLECLERAMERAGGKAVSWMEWQEGRYRHGNAQWQSGEPIPENCGESTLRKRRRELLEGGFVHDHGDGHFATFEIEGGAA